MSRVRHERPRPRATSGFDAFARTFGPMRVLGMRVFRVVMVPVVMVVTMSVVMVVMMRMGILHLQPAHPRAEGIAQLAIGHV